MTDATPDFEEIAETFAFLDDWEDRYGYVIELGKAMEPMPDSLKGPETKVEGCASQVWIAPRIEEGPPRRLHFQGDSDAMIVRGLIAILRALYSGRTLDEIRALDAQAALDRLGLAEHLSAQRSNGLRAMVGRIRALAGAETV
ncbi:SufE family protein [Oceanicella actignis]|uniref:SufE family protein n=1 Tax=Oceanicella actignis TaxID=1189325 RepID=UPI0011E72FCC|nr:SufE family protein [Oceanicella actignis]TYO89453.1 cysteine desulfuration protein SufE [Oceanicella actignis]